MSVKYNYVLFPLDVATFAEGLATRQYTLLGELPSEAPVGVPGARLMAQGPVGRRGGLTADINGEKQFFGLSGDVPASELFEELSGVIRDFADVLSDDHVSFFELQARYRIGLSMDAFRLMSQLGARSRLSDLASECFGQPMQLFSAQVVGGPAGPNSPDYLELWLQPFPAAPNQGLGASLILRKPTAQEFKAATSRVEQQMDRLVMRALASGAGRGKGKRSH